MSIDGAGLRLPFSVDAVFALVSSIGVWSARMPGQSLHLHTLALKVKKRSICDLFYPAQLHIPACLAGPESYAVVCRGRQMN